MAKWLTTLEPEPTTAAPVDQGGWIGAQLAALVADGYAPGFGDTPDAQRVGRQVRRCIITGCLDSTTVASALDLANHAREHVAELPPWAKRGLGVMLSAEGGGDWGPDPTVRLPVDPAHVRWLWDTFGAGTFTTADALAAGRSVGDASALPPGHDARRLGQLYARMANGVFDNLQIMRDGHAGSGARSVWRVVSVG